MNKSTLFLLMVSFALVFTYATAASVYAQSPSGGDGTPILGGSKDNMSSSYNQTNVTADQPQQQQQGSAGAGGGGAATGQQQDPLRPSDASSNRTIVVGEMKQQELAQNGGPLGQLGETIGNLTGGNK
ncbi:MAG: hypothetical protein M3162_02680 [Thermoproteota archaeon]|nr:hypothetical protein [Thermoproteota archaeon]